MSTTVTIQSSSIFAEIEGQNASHATARNTADNFTSSGDDRIVGQDFHDSTYFNYRLIGFKFGISTIPEGAIIKQVNMRLVATVNQSVTDFDLQICQHDWSATDPVSSGNMETAYDAALAAALDQVWRNTSGMAINTQYTSPDLDVNWIQSQLGQNYYYYSLRSSRDANNNTPTGAEYIRIATKSHATESYRPVLLVTYTGIARKFFFPPLVG